MISLNFAYLINILFLYSGMIIKFLNSLVLNSLILEVALLTCFLAKAAIPLHLKIIFGTFTKTITWYIASYYCGEMLINLSCLLLLNTMYQFFDFLGFFRNKREKSLLNVQWKEAFFQFSSFCWVVNNWVVSRGE